MLLTFKLDDRRASAKLKALEQAIGNPQPLFEVVGNTLLNRIRLCFKLGIDPWGDPWRPIKWRAARKREDGSKTATGRRQVKANAAGSPGQPLRDTGRLQRSITARADANGVTVGTNLRTASGVLYPAVHQFGATITPKKAKRLVFPGPNGELVFAKKVTIPARPFLPLRRGVSTVELPPAWSLLVSNALKTFLKKATEKAGA